LAVAFKRQPFLPAAALITDAPDSHAYNMVTAACPSVLQVADVVFDYFCLIVIVGYGWQHVHNTHTAHYSRGHLLVRLRLTTAPAYVACLLNTGQGYHFSSTAINLGVSGTFNQLQQLYSGSKAWKKDYKQAPAAACNKRSRASLCAAQDMQAADNAAQLQMATSPSSYSSMNPSQVGNIRLVAAAGNQLGCHTCVAFAVTSAAETAMAAALGVRVAQCSISVQGLYFCDEPAAPVKSCRAGWTLPEALRQLALRSKTIPTASCLPYKPDEQGQLTPQEMCEGNCSFTNYYASQGVFSSKQIGSVWEAQQHIRQYGSVVTRFDVYSGEPGAACHCCLGWACCNAFQSVWWDGCQCDNMRLPMPFYLSCPSRKAGVLRMLASCSKNRDSCAFSASALCQQHES
jgi:hypothetical protein